MRPDDARFILWDPNDGEPPRGEDGSVLSSGALGVMTAGNVYFTSYAQWPDARRPNDLAHVGARIEGVVYRLSGERGVYTVIRVK